MPTRREDRAERRSHPAWRLRCSTRRPAETERSDECEFRFRRDVRPGWTNCASTCLPVFYLVRHRLAREMRKENRKGCGRKGHLIGDAAGGYAERSSLTCSDTKIMRVIAGQYRRRTLRSLPGLEIRPTSDRLRETLFNVLCSGDPAALAEIDLARSVCGNRRGRH